MANRRNKNPVFEEPQDPGVYDHLRNNLGGDRIPGIREDVLGYGRWEKPEREDTVVLGHPEVAGQYVERFDRNSQFLESEGTERMDLNYVGPEELRRRSKGDGW